MLRSHGLPGSAPDGDAPGAAQDPRVVDLTPEQVAHSALATARPQARLASGEIVARGSKPNVRRPPSG
jgi:hypothetical protein